MDTSAPRGAVACRSVFVSPSCSKRYAVRSSRGASGCAVPLTVTRTGSPAVRNFVRWGWVVREGVAMDVLEQHEIAEANHRILNPFTEEKLMLLGEICRLEPGQQQLDLC